MHASDYRRLGFRITVSKRSFKVELDRFETGRGCVSESLGDLRLLYLGEVIEKNGILTGSDILQRFRTSGPDCAKDFDGAFLLVFLGHAPGLAVVITDPLNSLKCFQEEIADSYVLVSSLCFLPDRPRSIDHVAVTSFLSNGVVYNNRTIFEGVRALRRAGIHIIDARKGISSEEYWKFRFDNAFSGRSSKELKNDLADLLHSAAKRRIRTAEPIYLSLSGGYDSTCILGLLSKAAQGQVECFSYIVNNGTQGSDEDVAARMAEIARFRHSSVNVFDGDIVDLIDRNAVFGEGRANFCGELDAWQSIRKNMSDDAVFFVGDECFGWSGCRLDSDWDVLASVPIHPSSVLSPYSDCIDTEALGAEYDREIIDLTRAAFDSDLHNTKDFLYLDQRLGNVIMPWRELFAGRFAPVRNLLLDKEILKFVAHLPSHHRRGKKLYKETVRMMFPELFRVRRAFRYSLDFWRTAIYEKREAIEKELCFGTSALDRWLKLDRCSRLLPSVKPAISISLKARAITFGKKMLKESPLAHSIVNLLPLKPMTAVDPLVLLIRIAMLRKYLKETP